MAEGLTKKQIKELRKLEKLQHESLESRQGMVKWIAISFVSVLFLALFVILVMVGKQRNNPQTADGKAQFANNGHLREITSETAKKASNSAKQAEKTVTMVEYADFECPACKAYYPMVKNLLDLYPNQLKLIFKHFPISSLHKNAIAAGIAAEAAGRQNKFFEMGDTLYEKQDEWASLDDPQPKFQEYATAIGLNMDQFKKDEKDPSLPNLIQDERNEGIKNGVNATPSFFINGVKIDNPQDIQGFQKIIDAQLNGNSQNNTPKPTAPGKQLPLE